MLTRALPRPDAEPDPLFPTHARFTLGTAFDRVEVETARPSMHRPFGLRYVVDPTPIESDISAVRYDSASQTTVISSDGRWVSFAKHSTGTTNTKTSDGKGSMDSDSDHTED